MLCGAQRTVVWVHRVRESHDRVHRFAANEIVDSFCLADESLRDDRTVPAGLRASRAPNPTWTPRARVRRDSPSLFGRLGRRCGQVALDATVRHQPAQCHDDVHRQAEPGLNEGQADPEAVQEGRELSLGI
jgi:hypothetical protein